MNKLAIAHIVCAYLHNRWKYGKNCAFKESSRNKWKELRSKYVSDTIVKGFNGWIIVVAFKTHNKTSQWQNPIRKYKIIHSIQ